jgi:hypothetical protein
MRFYRGIEQFTTINHSKKLQNAGLSGYRAVYSNQLFKKCGFIGIKVSLQQSIIQKEQKHGVIGAKGSLQ